MSTLEKFDLYVTLMIKRHELEQLKEELDNLKEKLMKLEQLVRLIN